MRRFASALAIFGVLFGLAALVTKPHRLADWLFLAGIFAVLVLVIFASTATSPTGRIVETGGIHFLPRRKRRREDRPDDYDYPDAGR